MELKGKKMNVIGDSITEGVGVSRTENIYMNLIKAKEGLAEARNYGISGTRIAPQADDPGRSYVERFGGMDDDADIIVVFGGTNDYGHGYAEIGTMEDRDPKTFYGACHTLFAGLINKYPEATIVVMTPVQRSGGYDESRIHPSKKDVPLRGFRNILIEVAEYYSIPLLDLYSMGGIHPQIDVNREKFCPDGLHPNDEGHQLIASRLTGFLKSL
ncbi:MAG: SGNH/GDSL hydrolase family protein [Clostridia bacterium]|nr:SGNH/GDSL hydrolase family protein [Clostridia bacterium]